MKLESEGSKIKVFPILSITFVFPNTLYFHFIKSISLPDAFRLLLENCRVNVTQNFFFFCNLYKKILKKGKYLNENWKFFGFFDRMRNGIIAIITTAVYPAPVFSWADVAESGGMSIYKNRKMAEILVRLKSSLRTFLRRR